MQEELIAVSEFAQYYRETTWIKAVTNLAKSTGVSITKAMSLLQIPEQEQQNLLALMEKEEQQQSPS